MRRMGPLLNGCCACCTCHVTMCVVSILTLLLLTYLAITEIQLYLSPNLEYQLFVDTDRSGSLELTLDVVVAMQCKGM